MPAFTKPVHPPSPHRADTVSMKLLFTNIDRAQRPRSDAAATAGDDSLGRGMDLALTVLAFLVIGWLLDRWLGLFPLFTIALVLFAAVGSFVRMKYVYDARSASRRSIRAS